MLIAEASAPEITSGAWYILSTLGGMLITRLFDLLGKRTDSRLSSIEAALEQCAKQHAACAEEREKDKAELRARDDRDRRALQKQIDELRGSAHHGPHGSADHEPLPPGPAPGS